MTRRPVSAAVRAVRRQLQYAEAMKTKAAELYAPAQDAFLCARCRDAIGSFGFSMPGTGPTHESAKWYCAPCRDWGEAIWKVTHPTAADEAAPDVI